MTDYAIRWALAAGANPGELARTWETGQLAEVPIGRTWDVVRITDRVAPTVAGRLIVLGVPQGPLLVCQPRAAYEWLIPVGEAAQWAALPQWGRLCVAVTAGTLLCPPPTDSRRQEYHRGRRWLVPPAERFPQATDSDALYEVLAAAVTRDRADEYASRTGSQAMPRTREAPPL